MSRRGRPSLAFQVDRAFRMIEAFGESKRVAKRTGEARRKIYAVSTRRTYLAQCVRFTEWAAERYGARWLVQFKPEWGQEYLEHLTARGRSGWYVQGIHKALLKLGVAVQVAYGCEVVFVPPEMRLPRRRLADRQRRDAVGRLHYTDAELVRLLEYLEARAPLAAAVLKAQTQLGLRISEAVRLRLEALSESQGAWAVAVRGKGGKRRSIPLPEAYVEELRARATAAGAGNRLFPMSALDVQVAVHRACRRLSLVSKGTHGVRHSYAVALYRAERQRGAGDEEARRVVRVRLGHGEHRADIGAAYVPRRTDPEAWAVNDQLSLGIRKEPEGGGMMG